MGGEDAVAFCLAPAYPAAELVQLAQTEPVGVLNDHQRGVGNVHAHLDDRGRHHDIRFPTGEGRHGRFLFRTLHLSVEQSDAQVGENRLLQGLRPDGGGLDA